MMDEEPPTGGAGQVDSDGENGFAVDSGIGIFCKEEILCV
jgi:hypothetical protein